MIQVPQQLSCRPLPHALESVLGYWVRLALENGIQFSTLMRVFPPAPDDNDTLSSHTQLSAWAGQFIQLPSPINPRWVLAHTTRWCPLCLAEDEYWRPNWELAMVSICPVHQIQLYDRCPSCAVPAYYTGLNFAQCVCGGRLTSTKRIVSVAESEIDSTILSALYPSQFPSVDKQRPLNLHHLTVDQLHQFMLFVGSDSQASRKANYKTDICWSIAAAERVNQLLVDWPDSYFAMLDTQLRSHPDESVLSRQFGYYYRAVFKEFKAPEFEFLRDATESYLSEKWPGTLDQRHRYCSDTAIANNHNLCQTKVAKTLHFSARNIRRWLQDKKITGQLFKLSSGRTRATVRSSDFTKIAALDKYIHLYQAAIALELPERRVIELIKSGIIYGSAPQAGESWLIPVAEIKMIRGKLNELILSQGNPCITWSQIFRYHMARGVSFGALISAVLAGNIRIAKRADREIINSFEDFLVEKSSLKSWLESSTTGWTLPSLESRLGMKQEVIYQLAKIGLIRTTAHGRLGRRVSNDEVQHFEKSYITGAEIAGWWKTSPRTVEAKLADQGIHPICGPKVDGCRQNIYLREQLDQLVLEVGNQTDS